MTPSARSVSLRPPVEADRPRPTKVGPSGRDASDRELRTGCAGAVIGFRGLGPPLRPPREPARTMNWDAISAVGEIVGAIGVIVSLIYLAVQIRENTRSSMLTALNETIGEFSDQARLIAGTPDLAAIVLHGHESLENLTPEERLRFDGVMEMHFNLLERWLTSCRRAGMDQEQIDITVIIARDRFANPGVRAWWKQGRGGYPTSFVAWVDAILAKS